MMILRANEGKFLTNGVTYGKTVYLGVNDSAENWYEVTIKEEELDEGGDS